MFLFRKHHFEGGGYYGFRRILVRFIWKQNAAKSSITEKKKVCYKNFSKFFEKLFSIKK